MPGSTELELLASESDGLVTLVELPARPTDLEIPEGQHVPQRCRDLHTGAPKDGAPDSK